MIRRILLALVGLLGLGIALGAAWVASRQNLSFADTPFPDVAASSDSAVIARGEYVVRTAANCATCHGDMSQSEALMAGHDIPLIGGNEWDIPPGRFRARNITPDGETGIGRTTDGAIARALRSGVGTDGRALLPFMEFQGLSDEDLVAVVSYLRTQQPVRHEVPMHEYTLLGRVVRATVLANPVEAKEPPPRTTPHGATVENGRYLAESVALCWACHTQRDMRTGELIGPRFGGAKAFETGKDGTVWNPPNITADPATGRLGRMTEDQFVARFRAGRVLPGSPMPWPNLGRMTEDDLRAIYRYLKTVPPANRDVGPAMEAPKKG